MKIEDLKQELLDRKIRPLYVFTGDELALQDIYIKKIQEISGLEIARPDSVKSIYLKITADTLIPAKPKLYVIRNDEEFFKANKKTLLELKDLKGSILILLYSGISKSAEFCKSYDKVLTEFDLIGKDILKCRLQATTQLPMSYCEDFVRICGENYGRIQNELYKLLMLSQINGYPLETAYLEARSNDLIYEEIGDVIFDFSNAIVRRDIKKSFEYYEKVMRTDDGHAIKLLSVLYNSFRNVLMVQSTQIKERTEEVLGLSKKQIYITNQLCNKYNLFEIVRIIKTIRYLEKGIKTGTVDEKFAVPYLLSVIW